MGRAVAALPEDCETRLGSSREAKLAALSYGLTLVLMYVPLVMTILFLIGALLLLYRTRSFAVGLFVAGTLIATLGMHLIAPLLSIRGDASYQILVTSIATTLQAIGLLWYALSVRKHA